MAMLRVDNINVYYGAIHAVKNVSLEVNEGASLVQDMKAALEILGVNTNED